MMLERANLLLFAARAGLLQPEGATCVDLVGVLKPVCAVVCSMYF